MKDEKVYKQAINVIAIELVKALTCSQLELMSLLSCEELQYLQFLIIEPAKIKRLNETLDKVNNI